MDRSGIEVFGITEPGHLHGGLAEVASGLLDQLDPPRNETDDPVYPYLIPNGEGESERGEASSFQELLKALAGKDSATIGRVRNEMWLMCEKLPIVLNIYRDNDQDGWSFYNWHPWDHVAPDSHHGEANVRSLLEYLISITRSLPVPYAFAAAEYEANQFSSLPAHFERGSIDSKDLDLHWVNVFPPEVVKQFGRDKLLETPAHRVEELEDGSILLVVQEYPVDKNVDRWLVVRDHLDLLD